MDAEYYSILPKLSSFNTMTAHVKNDRWMDRVCSWEFDGCGGPGIYPIEAWTRSWYLDENRTGCRVEEKRVQRTQIPLCPAFAMTCYSSLGVSLPTAIVDFVVGRDVHIRAPYVAATRVKTRQDMLIFRAFDDKPFLQGDLKGPALLLKILRKKNKSKLKDARCLRRLGWRLRIKGATWHRHSAFLPLLVDLHKARPLYDRFVRGCSFTGGVFSFVISRGCEFARRALLVKRHGAKSIFKQRSILRTRRT